MAGIFNIIDITTTVSAAVGALIAFLLKAWGESFVRNHQSQEKSRDNDLTELVGLVESVRSIADIYWTTSAVAVGSKRFIDEARITAALHHANSIVVRLFDGRSRQDCQLQCSRFMDAVAGGEFGNADRLEEPNRLTRVHVTAMQFIHTTSMERRKLKRKMFA